MAERENGYGNGFLTGAIIGGAIGALAALILAPKSGKELRRDIADRSGELYDRAQDYLNRDELGSELPPIAMNEGRARAERIVQTARDHAETLLSNAEQVMRDARLKAVNAKDSLQENISKVRDAARASVDAFKSELDSDQHKG